MMRILIISQSLYGVGIHVVLSRQDDWQVQHIATLDPEAVAACAASYQPHVTLLDGVSLEALALLQELALPHVKLLGRIVVMVAGTLDGKALFWLAKCNISACVQSAVTPEDLATLVLQVSNDERLVSDYILELPRTASFPQSRTVVPVFPQTTAELAPDSPLSAQEEHILFCIAQGKANKQIAGELLLNEATFRNNLRRIFARLGVKNRTSAVVYALQQRWVRMPKDSAFAYMTAVA